MDPTGQVTWQAALEGIRYPMGILETADGGILVLEPGKLHKLSGEGEPLWSRSYYYSDPSLGARLFGPVGAVRPAGEGSLVIGQYGDISTLDREGEVLDVDLTNTIGYSGGESVTGAVPGASYRAVQESRTVYQLSRFSNGPDAWEIRFDFIAFDVTLFPPYHLLGTRDGGALFLAPAPHLMGDGAFSIFAARLNRTGEVLWQQIYQGIYEDDFSAAELLDGGFLIANTHTFYGREYSGSFLRLTRLNSTGDLVWDRVYGDGDTQIQIRHIVEALGGGTYLVGQYGFRGESDTNQGVAILSLDEAGRIPGCRYLAEIPPAETLKKTVSTRLTASDPRPTRLGEISAGESAAVSFDLLDSDLDLAVICAYPDPELVSLETAESPGERTHIFTDQDGLLLGAAQGDAWIPAAEAASELDKIAAFQLYNQTSYQGETTGQPGQAPERSPCPSETYLDFAPGTNPAFRIALDGAWNALPRFLAEMSPLLIPAYTDPIENLLKENGIDQPQVDINAIYRVDLDGDGGEEVLLLANRNASGMRADGVSAGDYSLLLLRYLQGNQAQTVPLYQRYITGDSSYYSPGEIQLAAVLDLNGDGIMEVIAKEVYRNSFGYLVYDFSTRAEGPALYLYCGE
jgi:hypothetical protein